MTGRRVNLTANHRQLAAQVPAHWGRTAIAFNDAKLAIRKVAWRALLEGILTRKEAVPKKSIEQGAAPIDAKAAKRLGRLNDAVYKDWGTFLSEAEKRLGVELGAIQRDVVTESRLEVFHFLRCILGPVIESALLLDRQVWLQGELQVRSPAFTF